MKVPFSYLTEQFADSEPIFEKLRVFLKKCDFTLGDELRELESRYAAYCGTKHAVGVGSGTDALFLSLKALGIGAGDEVITVPHSFIATTGAIVQAGARPVYVDIDQAQNIDCRLIEAALSSRTKAILPVHWAGNPADMETLLEIAAKHRLSVVEDACQALGARIGNRSVGSFGVTGAFSLHPLKPLHVWGDGGMIVTQSDSLARELRLLRNHGLEGRDLVLRYGVNSRFDTLQAIVGIEVMESLEWSLNKRIELASHYDEAFSARRFGEIVSLPPRSRENRHVFHLYVIRVSQRDQLLAHLNRAGIEAKIHYPIPLHLQPAAKAWNYELGMFPVTEAHAESMLTLPAHQYLSAEQIDHVIESIAGFFGV